MNSRLTLGQHALNGADITMDIMDLFAHWLVVGGSGKGKSRLLANVAQFCFDRKHPLIVLDPGEELYRWCMSYAAATGNRSRVCSIDLNVTDRSFGFDWKKRYGVSSVTLAEQFYRTVCKVYGQPEDTVAPLTETWMRNTLVPLIECPHATLAEMLEFASPAGSELRSAILRHTDNALIRREWQAFESLKRTDREHLVMAVHNRAAKFTIPDEARRLFGQSKPMFDIGEAIEQRKVVLVNLAPIRVSRELQRMLGITIINQIVNYAYRRSHSQRRRSAFVICDEASEFSSDDLPLALDKLRKFGIFFILSYQTLAQAEKIPGYLDSLFANSNVKIAFRTSRRDAEELVGEMYPEGLIKQEVKDEIVHTVWDPVESTRTITSRSSTSSHGSSQAESSGFGSGVVSGEGFAWGISEPNDVGASNSGLSSQSFDHMKSQSSFSSDSISSGVSESHGMSESEAEVPFYEYMDREEVSSRTFYSVEELRERYISWLLLQPKRYAQVKVGDRRTIPIVTQLVEDIRVRAVDRQRVIDRSDSQYALPSTAVDRMIAERRVQLLGLVEDDHEHEEATVQETRWQ